METELEVFVYDYVEYQSTKDEERKAFLGRRIEKFLNKHPDLKDEYYKGF